MKYLWGVLFLLLSTQLAGQAVTFNRDVLPILQEHCQDCHRPGGANLGGMVAPMSFITYEETRQWASVIKWSVQSRSMPPWHASPEQHGVFANERVLSEEEIGILSLWADTGAPRGNPADAPRPVAFPDTSGWSFEPDLIIRMPEPYLVRDNVGDEYIDFDVVITEDILPEPRWVKAVEIRPGSSAVHHIIAPPLGGIAPGTENLAFPPGYARLLWPGATVTFQMHYNKLPGPGTAVLDQSEIGVQFYEEGEEINYFVETESMGMFSFIIPPGEPNYSSSISYTLEDDMQILWLTPHMHLRGKSARYVAVFPDGREQLLLHIPRYDFDWQHSYIFKEPVLAPKGTRVELTMWWDNSAGNPDNPDPDSWVFWGRPTTSEMGFGWMTMVPATPRHLVAGDPIPDDLPEPRPIFRPPWQ